MQKQTSRNVVAGFGALADTLANIDAALIAARVDIYAAEQADDFLELSEAALTIRKVLYKASRPLRNLGHV